MDSTSTEEPSTPTTLEILMYPEEVPVLQAAVDALPDDAVLVEFGSGGSTQFFANNLGDKRFLYSFEHDEEWFDRVTNALDDHPNRTRIGYYLYPPDFPLSRYVHASVEEEMPAGLQRYINPPLDCPWTRVDFVLVDGVARGACLATLRTKLAPGTTVLLHDYTGRENWYDWAVELYEHASGPVGRAGLLTLRVPQTR